MKVLQGISVLNTDGQRVPLEELWSDQSAVLVFVRHFG